MTDTSATETPLLPEETARLMRLATYASVSVALMLIGAKLVAWWYSGSLSLLAIFVFVVRGLVTRRLNSLADALAMLRSGEQVASSSEGQGDENRDPHVSSSIPRSDLPSGENRS